MNALHILSAQMQRRSRRCRWLWLRGYSKAGCCLISVSQPFAVSFGKTLNLCGKYIVVHYDVTVNIKYNHN